MSPKEDDEKEGLWMNWNHSFPECFVHESMLHILNTGKYVRVDRQVEAPRYDHLCFLMKARYNCATLNETRFGDKASDWKMVLDLDLLVDHDDSVVVIA